METGKGVPKNASQTIIKNDHQRTQGEGGMQAAKELCKQPHGNRQGMAMLTNNRARETYSSEPEVADIQPKHYDAMQNITLTYANEGMAKEREIPTAICEIRRQSFQTTRESDTPRKRANVRKHEKWNTWVKLLRPNGLCAKISNAEDNCKHFPFHCRAQNKLRI